MLSAVAEICVVNDVPCQVSLEERMGCGVGACLVCACKTVRDGEEFFSRVCKDGPVFYSEQLTINS
jgi:dihydroorotate dehydrogenase electron transfer subunit